MRIEDIEKLSPEDLEKFAEDGAVKIPEGLGERIEDRIISKEFSSSGTGRLIKLYWKSFAAVAAVAAAVAFFAIGLDLHNSLRTPADTFSSPEEAYTQVERTFAFISGKVEKGKSMADAAVPHMQITSHILNKEK